MSMEEVGTKVTEFKLHFDQQLSKCRCDELEERNKKNEARIMELEEEIKMRNQDYEELEAKFRELEAKYKSAELELKAFQSGTNEIVGHRNSVEDKNKVENHVVVDLIGEGDGENVIDHMAENHVLVKEKRKAENDDVPASGAPCSHTPLAGKEGICSNLKPKRHRKVRRLLSFDSNKNALSRPAPFDVIDIFDSDDDSISNNQENRKVHILTEKNTLAETSDSKKDEICLEDYVDVNECRDEISCFLASKRKRIARIVTSDTENDEDDNVPVSKVKKMHNQVNSNVQCGGTRSRRRLVTLRQCEEKVKAEKISPNMTSQPKQDGGIFGGVQSESECESSSGFIVDSSSEASDVSSADDVLSHSESDSVNFVEILGKLQRRKNRECEWKFEADMLSAFGKDVELCMRAVCALYRQQTSDEQVNKETKYENSRGFSKFDALRGTELAEFLIDGDPKGDLKRSKQQLEHRGTSAVELCRALATRYSKQLFEIYTKKEDPLFSAF